MPVLKLETTQPVPETTQKALMIELSKAVAEVIGKPEQYVMVTIQKSDMIMSGLAGNAAFMDLRSIGGLTGETNRKLTKTFCQILQRLLALPADRVYVTFTDFRPSHWGWNGETFA